MEVTSLLDGTRWNILKQASQCPKTMAEIAEATDTSVANVSQHLKLLEAYGYVEKGKEKDGKPGKPTNVYTLGKDFSLIAYAADNVAMKKSLKEMDQYHKMIFSILLLEDPEDHYYLHKLLWQNEELIEKCKAINYLRSTQDKIELFVITDALEEVRENFSNVTLEDPEGNEKEVVCWSHNEDELEQGLESRDEYYEDLVSDFHVIHDPGNIMDKWR